MMSINIYFRRGQNFGNFLALADNVPRAGKHSNEIRWPAVARSCLAFYLTCFVRACRVEATPPLLHPDRRRVQRMPTRKRLGALQSDIYSN